MQRLKTITWISFVLCWISIFFLSSFYKMWYSTIPEELITSAYMTDGALNSWGKTVYYGMSTYALLYLVFIFVLAARAKITRRELLLFAGTPVFAALIIAATIHFTAG